MTTDRFDRRLEAGLEQVALPSFPDYFDDILAVTSRTRQRPAWVFPERWIPMVDIARRAPFAPAFPWRIVAVLIALIVAAAVATAAFIGSQPRYPPPFGVARNGLVGFTANGDVMVADLVTGVSRTIATGQTSSPRFSLDGRQIAYFKAAAGSAAKHLVVTDVAGGQARQLTTDPIDSANSIAWSPDGTLIAIDAGETAGAATSAAHILIASTDGSGVRPLDVGMPAAEPQWAPPDGRDILFRGWKDGRVALFLVHPDGTGLRPLGITTTATADDLAMAAWSPDGSRIAYVYRVRRRERRRAGPAAPGSRGWQR